MGKSGYKKFMKKERAKVKLKSKNQLLPKGQNVTDLNFKVKKIVIKTQLKNHEEAEILSSRKLNFQEISNRMGHYSGNVSLEAIGQLESLLKQGGRSFISSHLSPIVTQLAKLLTSPYSNIRKASIKNLSNVLSQINEDEWDVTKYVVMSYIVCGLSHVDPNIRSDSLLALDVCPKLSVCVDSLLPSLLDLLSTSRATGSRSLNTPLSASPTAYRSSVLSRIQSVLVSIQTPPSSKSECEGISAKWSPEEGMRVPIIPSFPLSDPLSISSYTPALSQTIDLKEFASSLIPLMMDSFTEAAPPPDHHEPVCLLTYESSQLLRTVADIMILLYDLLTNKDTSNIIWMKEKFGNSFLKRLIENRFPYSEEVSKKRKGKSHSSPSHNSFKLNLSLAFITFKLNPSSSWPPILHYLSGILRNNTAIEEMNLLGKCLTVYLSSSASKASSNLLTSLAKIPRVSPLYSQAFSILSKLVLSTNDNYTKELMEWLDKLIKDLASPDQTIHSHDLEFLKQAAPLVPLPLSFDSSFTSILSKIIKTEELDMMCDVCNLLYWVKDWQPSLLDLLADLVQKEPINKHIGSHIINLISYKCHRYPELNLYKIINNHSFWSGKIQTVSVCY